MVEQRRGDGPDKIIKQEHMHFTTLIQQRTLSNQTISLSLFILFTTSCLCQFCGKIQNLDHMNVTVHTQLVDTGEMGSSYNSSFLVQPCIQYSYLMRTRLHLQGARKDYQCGVRFSS